MDLKTMKEKDCTEVVHKLNDSMAGLKFILRSEEEQHNTDDFIFDLTCTLAIVCDAPAGENTNKILAALKGSAFFNSKIPYLLDRIQKGKTTITDPQSERRLVESLIKVFNKYLMHLPSSYADPPYDPLRETLDQSNIDGKDELKKQLDDFKQRRNDIIKAERQKLGGRYANKTGQKPPNDFRDIPICPTNKEIKSQDRPFLRKNIKKGRYEDVEHYLDVQFRLLREDFLEPLREGIHEITHKIPRGQRNQMMKCYQGVRIVGKELTLCGVNHVVQFDVSKFGMTNWAQSKRLIFGSFLCLSQDNFETMLFATVANRDPKDLSKGRFYVRFIEEQNIFDIEKRQQEYQMVESPAYFEAYRHVLKGLKGLNEDSMPFTNYLVECSAQVEPPEYLRREDDQDPVYYDLSKALGVPNLPTAKKVAVLESEAWPSVQALHLNHSQLEALRTAVTTEFAVIQGPPGTGKTYVGAKIVRCLLENRKHWDPDKISPMLMVCYTNHALDQFLVKVLEFLPKREIIRVGGRCKSEQLEECNLKRFTRRYRNYSQRGLIQKNIRENEAELEACKVALAKAGDKVLEFSHLEGCMNTEHADQLYDAVFPPKVESKSRKTSNTFKLWLSNHEQLNHVNQFKNVLKEHETGESQDGSILSQDGAGEEVDEFYCAPGPAFEFRTTRAHSEEDVLGCWEHSEDSPKESTTKRIPTDDTCAPGPAFEFRTTRAHSEEEDVLGCEEHSEDSPKESTTKRNPTDDTESMPIFESDQSQSANSKGDNSLTQNESSVGWDQKVPAEGSSKSQALLDEVFFETRDVSVAAVTQDLEEQSQLSDLLINREADELTITVEDEATRIQNERYIEGDEEYTLPMSHQSLEETIYDESERERIEDTQEEAEATYKKESNPFVWQTANRGSEWIDSENNQRENTTETRTKEKTETNEKGSKTFVWQVASRGGEPRPMSHEKIDLTGDVSNLQTQLQKLTMMSDNEAARVANIWELSAKDRRRLYLYWVECYRERKRIEVRRAEQKHGELCAKLEEANAEEEEEVIRRATVVGMTTSGAARYHSMLLRISPKIVIIEEAAEVLEAHIITSLSRNTKHTILIGDHKQLRPKATVYELAQKYNLEISLFERMVLNSMDCKRLSTQHRMRPEIAALTKRIYDHEIVDHESVCAFDDISGLQHNMFFIDHHQPEVLVGGMQSYSNPHEAGFLVALCRYLLLQGYKREQITILTMYTGQFLELKNRMPRSDFEGIKVCVVDNFQGEENDIILLSLVRSSKIGFLKESNRICVALSRARQGFYCIGNFTLLKSQCMLWKEICDDLQTKNAIGQLLTLVCKRHNNANEVRNSCDIQKFPLGGCDKLCGVRLDCGHACDRVCHPTDKFHEPDRCPKVCWKSCPNDHQCQRRCHHPLDCFCERPVLKIIPQCGHEQIVRCCTEPRDFVCQVKCEKTLQCGHTCENVCGRECTTRCNVERKKTLPCGHEKIMPCFKDPIIYNQCKSDCNKVLECGHPCSKKCKERCHCNTTVEVELQCKHQMRVLCPKRNQPLLCFEECSRGLKCGHECPGLCHEDCTTFQCEILVEKILPCDHKQILPCHFDPRDISCREMCQKNCNRGHPCQQRCHYGFPCKDCKVMVNMTIPSCNHNIEIPCYLDPAALACKKPCERVRGCGHPCRDVCSRNCDARPCMKLVPRPLPCGHTVTLACNKNLKTYKCKVNVVVDLSCGHSKTLDCYAKEAGLRNVLCNEKVAKELPCKHEAILQCHTNTKDYKCMKKVNVTMACGHTMSVTCNAERAGRLPPCMIMRTRKLSCEHEVTIPCCEIHQETNCKEIVDITMSCGHEKRVECSKTKKVSEDEKCDVVVKKTLRCGHAKEVQCSVKPEEIFCDAPCEQVLSCTHPCRGRCSDDCSKVQCAERVEKNLSCGHHKISCLCPDDVSQIICPNKCTRKLSCGHLCIGKCSERCSDYQCEEMATKELNCPEKHYLRMPCVEDPTTIMCLQSCRKKLDCGHPCEGFCGQPCEAVKCKRKIPMTFPCGHKKWLSCFLRKRAICRAPCLRPKSSCGHLCKGWCGEPCSKYPCNKPVFRMLRCGHNIEMRCCHNPEYVRCPAVCGVNLPCGHQCSGRCSDCRQRNSHEICQNPCRRILVCLHRCRAICCEPCPPCVSRCSRRCPHEKCKKHCSMPCNPCGQPCTWNCPHYQCNNLCGEECDRPRCDAPCPKKLPKCGHPCIGLCGETCPTACAICPAEELSSMERDGRVNKTEPTRCLQLFDCGHIITVKEMDQWMFRQQSSDVQLMRCPRCSTSITFSYRYGNLVKRTLKNVDHVKAQVHELAVEVSNSVNLLGRDLRNLKFDAKKLKFPQTVLRVMQFFPRDVHQTHERTILFLFIAKNHLTILKKAQASQQVLAQAHTDPGISAQQGDVEQLKNITSSALENIKEYLEQPRPNLKTLCQVHEHTTKFFLFSHVLEAQVQAAKHQTPLSRTANNHLKVACDRFALFFQGNDHALDLEWLRETVHLLRTELQLPPLPPEEADDFRNFPGYQRGVWKSCDQGHVYFTGWIVRGGEDIAVGSEGCSRCGPRE